MNRVAARVKSIEDKEIVVYITLEINNVEIMLIESKMPQWLNCGEKVFFTFQEVSVCVGKACNGKISIENRIPAVLDQVRTKGTMCELTFQSDIGKIVSLMTQKSYEELQLEKGEKATILLREIDISLEPYFESAYIEQFLNSRMKVAN
jgi:ABC-type molybdate transport system ATPase subunit